MIIKLLSYNIRFGGRGREDELSEVIRAAAPDLVVFQEATDPDVIGRLAAATDLSFWAARREHSIGYISRVKPSYHEWHYPAGAKHSFLEIVLAGSEERIFGPRLHPERFSMFDACPPGFGDSFGLAAETYNAKLFS